MELDLGVVYEWVTQGKSTSTLLPPLALDSFLYVKAENSGISISSIDLS